MGWNSGISRREFIWAVGSLSAMAAVGGVGIFIGGGNRTMANPREVKLSAAWLPKGETSFPLFKTMIEKASDFTWLKKGESILVKVALNSGSAYPATSDPWVLDCLLKVLKARGAGKVYVGDQAGVRHVFWTAGGKVRGNSRVLCQMTGLMDVIEENGAIPVFFEERGYDSYIETYPAGKHHWKTPMYVTSFVKEVDHIVYLPRISSHILADFTSGLKIGVGFLREDSRRAIHQGGDNFHRLYEEINEVPEIKSKLRLIISSGRLIMSLGGPDAGYVVEPYAAPVFASENLLAHEIFAYSCLQYVRDYLTPPDAADAAGTNLWQAMKTRTPRNRGFLNFVWQLTEEQVPAIPVFQPGDVYKHPAIQNYIELNHQEDLRFSVVEVNENPDYTFKRYLTRQLQV